MNGGFDRTSEFRTCIQLFHQRISTGRMQLKYRASSRKLNFTQEISAMTSDFFHDCREMRQDLKNTRSKLVKLDYLLKDPSSISTNLNQLIDVIQHDILDLNKTKTELNGCLSRIHTASLLNPQYVKHIRLIITGLEYHLSNLVSNFRNLLDHNKSLLSLKSQEPDQIHGQKQNPLVTNPNLPDSLQNPDKPNQNPTFGSDSSPDLPSLPTRNPTVPDSYDQANLHARSQSITQNSNPLLYPPIQNGAAKLHESVHLPKPSLSTSKTRTKTMDLYMPHLPPENLAHAQDQVQLFANPVQTPFVDQEVRQRDAAMRRVESTIVQLGEIYEQFSTLVREQGDMVMRIDSNIDSAELNIDAAHNQFLILMRRVSANRAFMIKIFITILLCFLFFAWYVR